MTLAEAKIACIVSFKLTGICHYVGNDNVIYRGSKSAHDKSDPEFDCSVFHVCELTSPGEIERNLVAAKAGL